MNDPITHVVVYNPRQNRFHAESVEDMCRQNQEIFLKGGESSWYVLTFAYSMEDARQRMERAKLQNPRKDKTEEELLKELPQRTYLGPEPQS